MTLATDRREEPSGWFRQTGGVAAHRERDSAGGADGSGPEPETVLKRADDLMYQAKAHGKDRVEV